MSNNNTGKVLVTGGAGFIGSNLVDLLIQNNYNVVVLDNFSTGREDNLEKALATGNLEIVRGNMNDIAVVKKALQDVTTIHHVAAQPNVRVSVDDPIFDLRNNVEASIVLFEEALKQGIKKIIYASSGGATYGDPTEIPVPENHPTNPISPYGITKLVVEKYLYYYKMNYGLNCLTLRYANVYGPRQDPRGEAGVISIFLSQIRKNIPPQIFGDGKQTRDYIFVGDLISAHIAAMDYTGPNWIFNIGTGRDVSVLDLVSVIRTVANSDIQVEHVEAKKGEVYKTSLDCRLAQQELNWVPKTDLKNGIQQVWEWMKESI